MKRLLLSNSVLLIWVYLFFQVNATFYNVIHFVVWQSLFTRMDYLWISVILLFLFMGMSYVSFKCFSGTKGRPMKRILRYEWSIVLVIAILSVVRYIYLVFFPAVQLIILFEYNKPYLLLSIVYVLEVGLLIKGFSALISSRAKLIEIEE